MFQFNKDKSTTVIIGGLGGTYVRVSEELVERTRDADGTLDTSIIRKEVIKFLEGIVLSKDMEIVDTPSEYNTPRIDTSKETLFVSTQEIADEINGVIERVIARCARIWNVRPAEDEDVWLDYMDNELSGTSEATRGEAFDTITRESIAGIIEAHLTNPTKTQ